MFVPFSRAMRKVVYMSAKLKNLRIVCPNCHTQTPTYKHKNTKHARMAKLAETRYA